MTPRRGEKLGHSAFRSLIGSCRLMVRDDVSGLRRLVDDLSDAERLALIAAAAGQVVAFAKQRIEEGRLGDVDSVDDWLHIWDHNIERMIERER